MADHGLITEVDSFCGCISLHYGAYIIAAVYFVLGMCGLGLSAHQQQLICSEYQYLLIEQPCASPFFVTIIVAAIIEIIVSALLAAGMKIKIRYILLPWVFWNSILVLLSVAFSIYVAAEAFSIRLTGPHSPPGFTAIIISALTAVPTLYSVVVVYSMFRLQVEPVTGSMEALDDGKSFNTKL